MKLTQEQENNILIAEFLGAYKKDKRVKYNAEYIFPDNEYLKTEIEYSYNYSHGYEGGEYLETFLTTYWDLYDMLFHKSWDWLIPVVEKIESLGYTVEIASTTCVIYKNIDYLTKEEYVNVSWKYDKKFDTIYNTILEFIKKYNNEKD